MTASQSTTQLMTFRRPSRWPSFGRPRRCAATLVACALGAALAGCANISDSVLSSAFVDPAKYDLYNCVQLRTARKENAKRVAELAGLRAKAETGAAGPVVSEIAYGNDYVAARAQARLADEVWQRNHCDQEALPPEKPDVAATAKDLSASGKKNRAGAR